MKNKGAVTAILEIYKKAIEDLKDSIKDISEEQLLVVVDTETTDDNCRSLQTILSHIVSSGYSYATSVHNHKENSLEKPVKKFHTSVDAYVTDLDTMFAFNEFVFDKIYDDELEENDQDNKMKTGWQQYYDIEQLMEHAIVHILRHHRQINNIIKRNFNNSVKDTRYGR
ncbi:DinB family protein [Flavobacterium amniphilum]|uniref:DinB family protein n=1 Tax=Flavobacterium amniphilum TaxID=1834035 RepID=UPI002029E54C|nr:DinB family protein [Flavobacterium amniphilum]MCL9804391.1 DinB family protein [Flavobacterium amniphilum]